MKQRGLSALQIVQLVAIFPVTLAAPVGTILGVFALVGLIGGKSASGGYLAIFGFSIAPVLALLCLWIAILSDDEAVAANMRMFRVLWVGLVIGCVLAGSLLVLLPTNMHYLGAAFFYGTPLAIGAWHVYRLLRIVWLPHISLRSSPP
jgi:hypothetical protein